MITEEKKLIEALKEIVNFLTLYKSLKWADFFRQDLQQLELLVEIDNNTIDIVQEKINTVGHLINLFSGIGYVSLVIKNKKTEQDVQLQFDAINRRVFDLALDLRVQYAQKRSTKIN